MKKRAKSALTLLEMSIAIFITGILLSSLWGMYHNWYKSYDKAQKTQIKLHRMIFLKHRLEQLFSQVAQPDKRPFLFTPLQNTLCLCYEGGPDPELAFNKAIRSLIFLDESKRLCLTTFSEDRQSRTEVLLDKVSFLEISFFDPQINSWQMIWPEEVDHPPLWVQLKWKRELEEETLIFRSNHPMEPILYVEAFEKGESTL